MTHVRCLAHGEKPIMLAVIIVNFPMLCRALGGVERVKRLGTAQPTNSSPSLVFAGPTPAHLLCHFPPTDPLL